MIVKHRYDKNGILLPADYQLEELPSDLYKLLSEICFRRLQNQEKDGFSSIKKHPYQVETPKIF